MAATTNLNIRIDKNVKDRAEQTFAELGLNMTMASAIEEGLRIALDNSVNSHLMAD